MCFTISDITYPSKYDNSNCSNYINDKITKINKNIILRIKKILQIIFLIDCILNPVKNPSPCGMQCSRSVK